MLNFETLEFRYCPLPKDGHIMRFGERLQPLLFMFLKLT